MESHDGRDGLLEQGGGVQEGPVPTQAHHEVDLVSQVVLLFGECHQLFLYVAKLRIASQDWVIHDSRLHKHHHPLLVDEPLHQLDEGRYDHGVPHLFDHEHRKGRLVPSQSLRRWVLDSPVNGQINLLSQLFS